MRKKNKGLDSDGGGELMRKSSLMSWMIPETELLLSGVWRFLDLQQDWGRWNRGLLTPCPVLFYLAASAAGERWGPNSRRTEEELAGLLESLFSSTLTSYSVAGAQYPLSPGIVAISWKSLTPSQGWQGWLGVQKTGSQCLSPPGSYTSILDD